MVVRVPTCLPSLPLPSAHVICAAVLPSLCFPLPSTAWSNKTLTARPCACYLALVHASRADITGMSISWWKKTSVLPLKQQPITSYLGILPSSHCKKEIYLFIYLNSLLFVLCFHFTSPSCSDIDVFLWKSSCASGSLLSFMILRENICCCCSLIICLQLSL